MRVYDIISKKRDAQSLTKKEIDFIIKGFTNGEIPDYQVSALLMAVYLNDLTKQETVDLTMSIVDTGERVDLSKIRGIKVDKHSTGGVGDKVTLVLGPMIAAAGLPFAKMSGRGLGHTGGTADKLESIPGFKTELDMKDFVNNVNRFGVAVNTQSSNITPADKKLYALRDVTATVENISLIASSIMSKKIASGADKILLDVKVGSGAFMKDMDKAISLAEIMVGIGEAAGKQTIAVITNMDQPLGNMIGNSLEVRESIEVLKDKGPYDVRELCLVLGSYMLLMANQELSFYEAKSKLEKVLKSLKGLEKLKQMIQAQGGDYTIVDNPDKLTQARYKHPVYCSENGQVLNIDAKAIGVCALILGAGREDILDTIDHSVGIELNKKIGEHVFAGEVLAYIHCNNFDCMVEKINKEIIKSYSIGKGPAKKYPLVYGIMDIDGYKPYNYS